MGPILIFDKSLLQSLNPDESVLLDQYFLCNITPMFFMETLADLEKEVRGGRTPEQVVGQLAYKTPDMHSCPNVHHNALLTAELSGVQSIEMKGRPVRPKGRAVRHKGQTGVIFDESPEEAALTRWYEGDFLRVERYTAKQWRRELANTNLQPMYEHFKTFYTKHPKPKSLVETRRLVTSVMESEDQGELLRIGAALVSMPRGFYDEVRYRWAQEGCPHLSRFAPYFSFVMSIDLFFYLAIAADLMSRAGPSHKMDIAYLYYLPFCMVFTSCDHIQEDVAPLFMRPDQTFASGKELKADLKRLQQELSAQPEEVKQQGLMKFAMYPPTDASYLITRLWDKHAPLWRGQREETLNRKPLSPEAQAALLKLVNQMADESEPADMPTTADEASQMIVRRRLSPAKGSWLRFKAD